MKCKNCGNDDPKQFHVSWNCTYVSPVNEYWEEETSKGWIEDLDDPIVHCQQCHVQESAVGLHWDEKRKVIKEG